MMFYNFSIDILSLGIHSLFVLVPIYLFVFYIFFISIGTAVQHEQLSERFLHNVDCITGKNETFFILLFTCVYTPLSLTVNKL